MKKRISNNQLIGGLFCLFLFIAAALPAQVLQPVKWELSAVEDAEVPGQYVLVFKADIEEGWKAYSQDTEEGGPIPTTLNFKKPLTGYELVGEAEELGHLKMYKEPLFNCVIVKGYEKRMIIRQKVKVMDASAPLEGFFDFQACDAQRCLPSQAISFSWSLGADPSIVTGGEEIDWENLAESYETAQKPTIEGELEEMEGGECDEQSHVTPTPRADNNPDDDISQKGLWSLFLLGMSGGLLALFTPCVFPMIPLTVSFFTKQSKTRSKGIINASIYALSIIIIFIAFGFLVTLLTGGDPKVLNALATNMIINLLFFVVFIVFAISFFGAFEITLPSKLVNKMDSASDQGGLIGIFFMAFTLVLVSFSCTVPIVGSLIILIASQGAVWGPAVGLLGFSLVLAIPFALFALFPGWLNSLPKSGGWLNSVKVVLGFIELALAFKFLSNVDLAYGWNFFHRDIFLSLWIIIFGLLGFYLLGKIRFKSDAPMEGIPIPRLFLGILTLAFTIYMIPGLWGAPVSMLSGVLPPNNYQEFNTYDYKFVMRKMEDKLTKVAPEIDEKCQDILQEIPPTVTDKMQPSHHLNMLFDYDQARELAICMDRPLFVDFTGWNCASCRRMEDNVWSDDKIWNILNEDYIIVSLYTDDKASLPAEYRTSPYTGNSVSSLGELWLDMQVERFNKNAQPLYVLVDPETERQLASPRGYTPSIDTYFKFLQSGLENYKKGDQ